jgi:hypothetical protein
MPSLRILAGGGGDPALPEPPPTGGNLLNFASHQLFRTESKVLLARDAPPLA